MIINILQENLLKAVVRTARIISSKPQLPILQNILLVAQEGGLRVVATNMETTESVFVAAKTEKTGGICIPSRIFSDLVMTLPQETVRIHEKDGSILVSCGGVSAVIPGISQTEYPPIPETGTKGGPKIDKTIFINTLSQVLFAAATDEGRPLLTGVKITKKAEKTVFAATDGYRLSVKTAPLSLRGDTNLVVPARALAETAKVALEEKETKEVSMLQTQDNQLGFLIEDTHITTRLIDGDYPNYEKIIPTKHTTRALVDAQALARSVKSAAIFARDNANIVKIRADKQKIVISANTPSVGENSVEIDAKVDGEGGEIAFNSRFLLEFLGNYTEEELLFEMTGSLNPGVFRPVKDDSFLHIIMPVRVQG